MEQMNKKDSLKKDIFKVVGFAFIYAAVNMLLSLALGRYSKEDDED